MPGTWPDDDGIGDDDADDPTLGAPVHPDDRLWRHPSEMAWGVAPSAAMTTPPFGSPVTAATEAKPHARTWVVAVASGLSGAAIALGMVVVFAGIGSGRTDRVIERIGVRDILADPAPVSDPIDPNPDPNTGIVAIAREVIPSIVRLEVGTRSGSTTVGSGVVVLDDGHILTNAHVVDGARTITIVGADGTAVNGQLVGADTVTDIAVVAPADDADTDDITWVPAVRGPGSDLSVGDPTLAVGSPRGLANASPVALGVVSALGRRVSVVGGGTLHGMIQTDAPIAAGSTGGALCDRTGRVVGITTAAFVGEATSASFATPMETAWRVAESLMEDGVVHHVWLGIEGVDQATTSVSILGLQRAVGGGGVTVDRVLPDSPAEDAGLEAGDVLTSLDGEPVWTMSDLVLSLRDHEPGDRVRVGVERDGDVGHLTVTLAERND